MGRSEIMKEKEQEQELLTAEEEKLLSEVIKENLNSIPEVHITPEELIALVEADDARRRKRFMKYASMAAVLILVCVAFFAVIRPGNAVPADADKNTEKQVEKNANDVVIKDQDTEGDSGAGTIEATEWDKVKYLKKENTTLYIPEYVPEEYEFQSAKLNEPSEGIYQLSYAFETKENKKLIIRQKSSNEKYSGTTYAKNSNRKINTKFGEAYATVNAKDNLTTVIFINEDQLLTVQGTLTIKEFKKICDNLELM